VFLFNESLGIGTDLRSNAEIEERGGNYLIMCDIFGER
jgi:hypothetical protein